MRESPHTPTHPTTHPHTHTSPPVHVVVQATASSGEDGDPQMKNYDCPITNNKWLLDFISISCLFYLCVMCFYVVNVVFNFLN